MMESVLEGIKTPFGAASLALFVLFWVLRTAYGRPAEPRPAPPWLIHVTTLAAVLVVILAGISELPAFAPTPTFSSDHLPKETWHAFYGDLDDKAQPVLSSEALSIAFDSDHGVIGEAEGIVPMPGGGTAKRKWEERGFYATNLLVLAEITRETNGRKEVNPIGVATYFMQRTSSANYVGILIAQENEKGVYACPVAMTTDEIDNDKARARWPAALQNTCKRFELIPESQH